VDEVGGVDQSVYNSDVCGSGRRGDSPEVRDPGVLYSSSPRTTNASRSRICRPSRPNTSDGSALFLSFLPFILN
jgi:hypothetical protein